MSRSTMYAQRHSRIRKPNVRLGTVGNMGFYLAPCGHVVNQRFSLQCIDCYRKSKFQTGKAWSGDHVRTDTRGYRRVRDPEVRPGEPCRLVLEHVAIARKVLGRPLTPDECVHHLNGNKADNRHCNLVICTKSYHRWLHNYMSYLYQQEHFT
jgi:hypothetical protein